MGGPKLFARAMEDCKAGDILVGELDAHGNWMVHPARPGELETMWELMKEKLRKYEEVLEPKCSFRRPHRLHTGPCEPGCNFPEWSDKQ